MLAALLRLATFIIIMIQKLSCNLDLTRSYNSHTDHENVTYSLNDDEEKKVLLCFY